jgi:hypothetical protein
VVRTGAETYGDVSIQDPDRRPAALSLSACTSIIPYRPEQLNTTGAKAVGAGGGAVVAASSARPPADPRVAALIGAGIGLTGAAIGSYMDQQEAELRPAAGTGVSVTRVGQQIILNMPSNITFATGHRRCSRSSTNWSRSASCSRSSTRR